jgi:hypothetical protein
VRGTGRARRLGLPCCRLPEPGCDTWNCRRFSKTTSIVGPGGRTFAATIPLARIQRYDSDGRFEAGWFVDSIGGTFAIGLTADWRIAVAAARTKRVEFFNSGGSSGPPQPFTRFDGFVNGVLRPYNCWVDVLRPSNCQVDGVAFADPIQVGHPGAHWATLVLFPLWHPFVVWLLVASGMVGICVKRYQNKNADGPSS